MQNTIWFITVWWWKLSLVSELLNVNIHCLYFLTAAVTSSKLKLPNYCVVGMMSWRCLRKSYLFHGFPGVLFPKVSWWSQEWPKVTHCPGHLLSWSPLALIHRQNVWSLYSCSAKKGLPWLTDNKQLTTYQVQEIKDMNKRTVVLGARKSDLLKLQEENLSFFRRKIKVCCS